MMLRRSIIHAFLSLLLVVVQQLAVTHVLSHGTDGRHPSAQRQQSGSGDLSRKLASDRICHQCLAFSQVVFAVGSPYFALAVTDSACPPPLAPATPATCLRTVCVFQSRAPPQA
jgi:hypothetical protein